MTDSRLRNGVNQAVNTLLLSGSTIGGAGLGFIYQGTKTGLITKALTVIGAASPSVISPPVIIEGAGACTLMGTAILVKKKCRSSKDSISKGAIYGFGNAASD